MLKINSYRQGRREMCIAKPAHKNYCQIFFSLKYDWIKDFINHGLHLETEIFIEGELRNHHKLLNLTFSDAIRTSQAQEFSLKRIFFSLRYDIIDFLRDRPVLKIKARSKVELAVWVNSTWCALKSKSSCRLAGKVSFLTGKKYIFF